VTAQKIEARADAGQPAELIRGVGQPGAKGLLVALRPLCFIRAMRRLRFLMGWLVVVVVTMLTGCTTVTETGRKQLNLIPASQVTQFGLGAFTR